MDEKGGPSGEDAPKAIKPSSKGFRKTRGLRRTTIAKREGAGDVEVEALEPLPRQQQSPSPHRSGRQPKRTERVEESLTPVWRRDRRGTPMSLEDSAEPASCPVTEPVVSSLPRSKVPRPAAVPARLPRVTRRPRLARPLGCCSPAHQCSCGSISSFPRSGHSCPPPEGHEPLSWFPCILRAVSGSRDRPTQSMFSPQAFLELGPMPPPQPVL
ncbi:death-inducer obliterator 1-like [Kogia breviceps]|uniref:death-inducer obliterator 1-like n=1 Tax=Kogia breviceps TaxID=27615 RepID=UPI0034D1F927